MCVTHRLVDFTARLSYNKTAAKRSEDMYVLVLSCNTGGGHNSAGSAVVEALQARGHTGQRVDFLGLAGQKVSELVSGPMWGW